MPRANACSNCEQAVWNRWVTKQLSTRNNMVSAMTLSWTQLTSQQQQALSALRAGRRGIDLELGEQLRNLGLAEMNTAGLSVSRIGETVMPTAF